MEVENAASTPAPAAPSIDTWSDTERSEWLKTGKTPEAPKPAEAAPATSEAGGEKPPAESAPESGTGKTQEPSEPRKPAKNAETRIRELVAKTKDLEAKLAAKEQPPAKPAEAKPAEPEKPELERPKKPKADDFSTYEEYETAQDKYLEDLADYKAAQRLETDRAARAKAQQEQTAAEQQQELAKAWKARVEQAKSEHEDFDEVAFNPDLQISQPMLQGLLETEHGASLLYHLGQHPDEAERIAKLGPVAAIRELVKLESSLFPAGKAKTPEPKKITAAAPPPTELGGKNTAPEDEAAAALQAGDFARYKRIMDARDLKK